MRVRKEATLRAEGFICVSHAMHGDITSGDGSSKQAAVFMMASGNPPWLAYEISPPLPHPTLLQHLILSTHPYSTAILTLCTYMSRDVV
jgi:hypothetical protein